MKTTLNNKEIKKLEAIYRLLINEGATAGERESAAHRLEELCQKFQIRLSQYISEVQGTYFDFDCRPAAEQAETKTEQKSDKIA